MLNSDSNQKPFQAGAAQFTNTHWSVVLAAREDESTQASAALEKLCRAYWYPLYAFIRRQGAGAHDAQDLTQAFFTHLLKIDFLRGVAPAKGKFRSFLLASLKNFLADERDRAAALKRGGGQKILSLDDDTAEARFALEPADPVTADSIFERRWAYALLETVVTNLREEFATAHKALLFDAFKPFLIGEADGLSYSEVAARLGMSEAAGKMTVTRMRRRYRELLRSEVANMVEDPAEIDAELRHLFAALQ